ncbi:MAG TPA: LuxR C-terminal-related transcriptional regulator [Acidimicrobiales bacterium]
MGPAPSAPSHAVDRPALRRQLDEAFVRPLTLIVAPAGAGKSVLLAQWVATHPELAFVWIGVEGADDDPIRLSQRLLQGIAAISPEFADLANLVSMHRGGLGPPLLEVLGTQMSELPEVVIILDDLHHLSNATLIADLGRLVEVLPSNVHMVLSTRVDLPIAWSRHRVRRDLSEIRQSDLAFDEADSTDLLEQITGRRLGPDTVTALVNRTEGWAAGLQLAGMTLRLHPDPDEFVAHFSGSDRLIADYLGEEVLQAQPDGRRGFLLEISVLDQMCAGLVGYVTGESSPQLVLEELERQSMFLVPLDTHREWFRFHHLFRDLLRFQLRAQDPDAEERLLARAASWHLERGEPGPAVEYLLRARNWDGALEVIQSEGSEAYERGEIATVIRWIDRVPVTARRDRQDVGLLLGALQLSDGRAAAAGDTLRRISADPKASGGERACALAVLAASTQWSARPDISVTTAERALALLAEVDPAQIPMVMGLTDAQSLETLVMVSGGRAHFLSGDFEAARDWLERSLASAGAAYSMWRVHGLGSMALLDAWTGNLDRADAGITQAFALAQETERLAHPSIADAHLARALCFLERGQPRRAALSLHEGTVRAEANRRTQLSWIARFGHAAFQTADGKVEAASATIRQSRSVLGAPPPPVVADRLLALSSRLLRLGGSPEQALRAIGDRALHSPSLTFESTAAALTLGRPDLARKIIDGSPPSAGSTEPLAAVERLLLLAWIADTEGSTDAARTHLIESLAVAERHSLIEVFVRAGPIVVQMVSALAGSPRAFRDLVLERAREAHAPPPGSALVDPLTDRELEILSYLPGRFTNIELAGHCYVSVNTIKTHMAHIYRKLGVANRNGAITRARQIGLL